MEQATIRLALQQALDGQGSLLLVRGEAGMGKTRLVDEVLGAPGQLTLYYACHALRTPPFAPVVSILRQYRSQTGARFHRIGPLAGYLRLLLPEMGPAPQDAGDQSTLLEAIRLALAMLSDEQPAAIVIDDLQWADNATLEAILSLATHLAAMPLLMVGIYRSDEIPRGHPLRWLRSQLRRGRVVRELKVQPLTEAGTAALAAAVVGRRIAPALARSLYHRSGGVPLFVEQLVAAWQSEDRLQASELGLQLSNGDAMPIPETIRDVVLLRLDSLSEAARQFAEVAAVMGERFHLLQVVHLAGGDEGLDQLMERRLIVEGPAQEAAFHHALTREVIYQEIPWTRRRALHRAAATMLAEAGAPAELVAGHWLEAKESGQARLALAAAARHACRIHAYRDAAGFGNQALELWPDGQEEETRLAVVEQFGNCAQLSGNLPDAARAWREAAAKRRQLGQVGAFAAAQRRLAAVLELQGAWTQSITARAKSADGFRQADQMTEAATEYLALASTLHLQGQFSQALQYAGAAERTAREAGRQDLQLRAAGLSGRLLAKLGQVEAGLQKARDALTGALDASITGAAAENFLNLAGALEQASDYVAGRAVYEEAAGYCSAQGAATAGQVCLACLAFVLWYLGEWDEAVELARQVLAAEETPANMKSACYNLIGRERLFRGDIGAARPALQRALVDARQSGYFNMLLQSEFHMAIIAARQSRPEAVMAHWQQAYEAWEAAEDLHYGVNLFRWGATHFAMSDQPALVRQSTSALNRIVTRTSNTEALAGLAHALGESLLLEGNVTRAVAQFEQAVSLLDSLDIPYPRARSLWRLGAALLAEGDARRAVEQLKLAHTIFGHLGARPDSQAVEALLTEIGQSTALPSDLQIAEAWQRAGLTPRQLEVIQLLAGGMTNREIAAELVLSPRTVEMHVGNVLNKLGCANRTEAVARAAELGLL